MAFRQVARRPEALDVVWPKRFAVLCWTEDKTQDIAQFMLGTGTQSFADLQECSDGTPASAQRYVTRAHEYMEGKPEAAFGYAASSLVYDTATNKLVAACLCCGPSIYFLEVHPDYQRRGLATCMLKRALTVCAEAGATRFDLWRNDDSPAVALYERLGFVPTGEVE